MSVVLLLKAGGSCQKFSPPFLELELLQRPVCHSKLLKGFAGDDLCPCGLQMCLCSCSLHRNPIGAVAAAADKDAPVRTDIPELPVTGHSKFPEPWAKSVAAPCGRNHTQRFSFPEEPHHDMHSSATLHILHSASGACLTTVRC